MARISRHHHGLRWALRSLADFDHIVDSDEMVFHPLAAVETGSAAFSMTAAVHIAEHASKIAAGPEFIARRLGAADEVAEWLDQSRTPGCDLPHENTP